MKITLPFLLIFSIISLSRGQSTDSHPISVDTDDEPASAPVDIDAAAGDAGKECAADDCPESVETISETSNVESTTESATETTTTTDEVSEDDPNCPPRPHVIRCAAKYLDTNHNGRLEKEELESAMGGVSWLLRGLLKIIGSVDTIMKKCDADGDGSITIDVDMEATKETCLATCFKRYAFKKLFFPECTE